MSSTEKCQLSFENCSWWPNGLHIFLKSSVYGKTRITTIRMRIPFWQATNAYIRRIKVLEIILTTEYKDSVNTILVTLFKHHLKNVKTIHLTNIARNRNSESLFEALARVFSKKILALRLTNYTDVTEKKKLYEYFSKINAIDAENTHPRHFYGCNRLKYFTIRVNDSDNSLDSEIWDENFNHLYAQCISANAKELRELFIFTTAINRFKYFVVNVINILQAPNAEKIAIKWLSIEERVNLYYSITFEGNEKCMSQVLVAENVAGVSEALDVLRNRKPLSIFVIIVHVESDLYRLLRIFTDNKNCVRHLIIHPNRDSNVAPVVMNVLHDVIEELTQFTLEEKVYGDKIQISSFGENNTKKRLVAEIKSGKYYQNLLRDVETIIFSVSITNELVKYCADLLRLENVVKLTLFDVDGKLLIMAVNEARKDAFGLCRSWSRLEQLNASVLIVDEEAMMEIAHRKMFPELKSVKLMDLPNATDVREWFENAGWQTSDIIDGDTVMATWT